MILITGPRSTVRSLLAPWAVFANSAPDREISVTIDRDVLHMSVDMDVILRTAIWGYWIDLQNAVRTHLRSHR